MTGPPKPPPHHLQVQPTSTLRGLSRLDRHIKLDWPHLKPQRILRIHRIRPLQLPAHQPDQLPQTRLLIAHSDPLSAAVPTGGTPPRLREDLDSLTELVRLAADHLGLDTAFLEKGFWVTELVRAVAAGDHVSDAKGNQLPVTTAFKGGTSLSRVFHIAETCRVGIFTEH